jgi:hypothetical protein
LRELSEENEERRRYLKKEGHKASSRMHLERRGTS